MNDRLALVSMLALLWGIPACSTAETRPAASSGTGSATQQESLQRRFDEALNRLALEHLENIQLRKDVALCRTRLEDREKEPAKAQTPPAPPAAASSAEVDALRKAWLRERLENARLRRRAAEERLQSLDAGMPPAGK
jgi:hypothetical protein